MKKASSLFAALGWSMLLIFFLTASIQAQPFPRTKLTRVLPAGGKAGTSVEVVVEGNLDDLEGLYFSEPGIKAELLPLEIPKPDPKTKKPAPTPPANKFKVAIPAATPIGICDVRAVGKWGISNPRAFTIGSLTEFLEEEPNNDVPQAQTIELNSTVNGTIGTKLDVDYYRFLGKKGQRVVLRCAGRSIDSKISPMLQMFDDGDQLLVTGSQLNRDLVADVILPRDAVYFIRLCEFAYQYGGADAFYRLSVTEAPWLDTVYPPVVEAGKTTPVKLFGRNLPNGKPGPKTFLDRPLDTAVVEVTAPAKTTDDLAFRGLLLPRTLGLEGIEVRMKNAAGVSNPLLLTYCRQPVTLEREPNDSPETAQELKVPSEMCGRIEKRRDHDWYTFSAKKGEAIIFECFGDRLGSPMDLYMQIWQPEPLQMIGEYDDHADLPTAVGQFWTRTEDPKVRWVPPADGQYLLLVTSRTAAMRAGPRFVYRLSVHQGRPDFHVVLIDDKDGAGGGFTLEQGGHQEFTVLCLREDGFRGEILLEAERLPKGVTCVPQVIGPEVSQSVLVLRAAADAPMAFGDFRVKATASVDGKQVVRYAHAGTLVWPNPQKNAPALSRLTRSLCVAVREPGPFTLDVPVRELSAPVGAKMEVKVSAQRAWTDFKGPIAVTRLTGPVQAGGKGIALPTLTIAANQNEGTVKFQLPTNTLPGTHSLVFQGKSKVPLQTNPKDKKKINVDFVTASPPIALTVFNTVVELSLSQPGIALKPGSSAALAIKVKRLHKYEGPVQIELVPQTGSQGISAAPLTLAAGKNEGNLILQVPKTAKPAVYPNFLVRASAKLDGVVLKEETKLQVSVSNTVSADGTVFEIKTIPLLQESSAGWKYLPAKMVADKAWQSLTFDDKSWKNATSPVGYGETEVGLRKGTLLSDQGQAICFRRDLMVPEDVLAKKGVSFRLLVASDDNATVFVNGQMVDKDEADHEFSYWNRDVVLPAKVLRPGRNLVAVLVNNASGSSDLYLDLAIHAQAPTVKPSPKK